MAMILCDAFDLQLVLCTYVISGCNYPYHTNLLEWGMETYIIS